MEPLLTRYRRSLADAVFFRLRATKRLVRRSAPIYFCLNSGRCGSLSMVRLLRANGVRNCYHELRPDLLEQGIAYYHGRIGVEVVAARLRRTRGGVDCPGPESLGQARGPGSWSGARPGQIKRRPF